MVQTVVKTGPGKVSLGGTTLSDGSEGGLVVSEELKNLRYDEYTFSSGFGSSSNSKPQGYTSIAFRTNETASLDAATLSLKQILSEDQTSVATAKLLMRDLASGEFNTGGIADCPIPGQHARGDLMCSAIQVTCTTLTTDVITMTVTLR